MRPLLSPRLHTTRQRAYRSAFTLIELLVAITIVIVLLALLSSLIQNVQTIIKTSSGVSDADTEGRRAISRFEADCLKGIFRSGLGSRVDKTNGNDELTFYAQVKGYDGVRNITKLTYRIDGATGLVRGAEGYPWVGNATKSLEFAPAANVSPINASEAALFDAIGQGVVRMELTFLMENGQLVASVSPLEQTPALNADQRVAAVIATFATVPRDMLQGHGITPAAFASLFPDAEDGIIPFTQWQAVLRSSNFYDPATVGAVPLPIRKAVRVYQVSIPLP